MNKQPLTNGQVIGRIVLAVVVVLAVLIIVLYQLTVGPWAERRALAKLDRIDLFTQLDITPSEIDTLIFEDGSDGWFAITDPVLVADAEIGYYGRRFFGELFNVDPAPMYCGGAGKALWAVKDQTRVREFAYCRTRRMDLANLRPAAKAVSISTASLSRSEIEALQLAIEADQALLAVSLPTQFDAYAYSFEISTPYTWSVIGDENTQYGSDAALQAALGNQFPELIGTFSADLQTEYLGNGTQYIPSDTSDGLVPGESGPMIVIDDAVHILTEVDFVQRQVIRFNCDQATCEALRQFDVDAYTGPISRNEVLITQALLMAVPLDNLSPSDDMARVTDLQNAQVQVSDTSQRRYSVTTARIKR